MSEERIRKPYLTWTDVSINSAMSLCCPQSNLYYKYSSLELDRLLKYTQQSNK